MHKSISYFTCLLILIIASPLEAFSQNLIYWSDTTLNQILRSNRDGSSVLPVINLIPGENGESLAIDDIEGKIYWSSLSLNRISRANLDGTNLEVIIPNASFPVSIQIDPLERKIYWASSTGVFRTNLDGTGQPSNIFNAPINDAWLGFALEPLTKKAFLSEQKSQNLTFGSYTGLFSGIQTSFLEGIGARKLAIDSSNFKIYISTPGSRKIYSSSITNPEAQLLLSINGIGRPESLAVDYPSRFVYWTDSGNNKIVRTSISDPSEEILTSSPSPKAIALDCGRFAPDSDNDDTSNCLDGCPNDPNKTSPGVCGCNLRDIDSDQDGILDCIDECPNDNQKSSPGICGCGLAENDDDLDGIYNCYDDCPSDTLKSQTGACGCGQLDNFTGDGSILCSKFRILSPISTITNPPQVIVKKRSATILMEKFAAVTDKSIKNRALDNKTSLLEARTKKKTKITSRYSVYLNRSGGINGKRVSAQSKRNTLTFKNLKPGEYSTRYRVEILKNDKLIGKTNRSPVTRFSID